MSHNILKWLFVSDMLQIGIFHTKTLLHEMQQCELNKHFQNTLVVAVLLAGLLGSYACGDVARGLAKRFACMKMSE